MAWVSVCVAALIGIALIVFMAQNTRRVQVSFLWMSTDTPLAIALLIAAVGSIMLTLILGTARIIQLRRLVHKKPPE
jgi:putative membrane protein